MEVLKKKFTAFSRYARFAVIFHFQLNIQGRKLFKCRWFDKLASHFLAGLTFSHHHLSPPERGRGRGCVQESRNGLQKKMCEQLLFLSVLLAVTFKCQDSSCPIRKDQSSHVEKSQQWLQFLTRSHRTSLLVPALEPPDASQPTRGQSRHSPVRALWGQGPQHSDRQERTRAGKHWPWELCHVPSVENKTRQLHQSPHTSAYVQWQEMAKVNVTSEMLDIFLFRFLVIVPKLLCSGSVLLAATSIILSWNTSKTHISVLLPHRQSWMLCTSCAEQTGGFYTPVSSLQNKGKKLRGGYRVACCQTKSKEIIKFKCNTKSKFYCKHLTLFSQDLQIYMWKSIAPNRSFALSFAQNPSLSRAGIPCSLTELIHLTSFNNSIGEEGSKKNKTKPKPEHKPYFFPWNETNPPDVILECMSGKSRGK